MDPWHDASRAIMSATKSVAGLFTADWLVSHSQGSKITEDLRSCLLSVVKKNKEGFHTIQRRRSLSGVDLFPRSQQAREGGAGLLRLEERAVKGLGAMTNDDWDGAASMHKALKGLATSTRPISASRVKTAAAKALENVKVKTNLLRELVVKRTHSRYDTIRSDYLGGTRRIKISDTYIRSTRSPRIEAVAAVYAAVHHRCCCSRSPPIQTLKLPVLAPCVVILGV